MREMAFSITMTLAFRPVGAFLFGLLADRYGRRLPLMIDLVFYSVVRSALRARAQLHHFPHTARALRHRHGRRMGRRRVAGHGESAARLRGVLSGLLQEGYATGNLLAAICYLLSLPALGLAAAVFPGRPAGVAGAVRAFPRERIRSLGKDAAKRSWSGTGPRHRVALEAIPLSDAADDDDELRLARHAGHVSHVPRAQWHSAP